MPRRAGAIFPLRLRTVLLLSNCAILVLPVAGFWALRLYESALVRQTESELVAQAAVLAGAMRERLRIAPERERPSIAPERERPGIAQERERPRITPEPGEGPAAPSAAALHLARHPGLDLASDPILPPQPEDMPGGPAEPAAAAAGRALTPVLRDVQAITLSSLRITDRAGVIVATTGGDLGRSLAAWPEVAAVLAGEPVSAGMHRREPAQLVPGGISRTTGLRVFVALPVDDGAGAVIGAVVLSRTPNGLASAIWGKWPALAELALVLLAGGALLAAGISRVVTKPLAAVVAQARAVAAGGHMTRLARPGTREVAALSEAVARMETILVQRAGYISGFAASVSHEFKTPLAAIRAAGELLEDHAEKLSAAERGRLLRLVGEGVARLDLLVRRLVEMARADMMRAMPASGAVTKVRPVLAQIAARFAELELTVDCSGDPAVAFGAEALTAVLVSLLENAAIHAPGACVAIAARAAAGRVVVTVRDGGPGVPAAHRAQVFEPFFTTARDRGGTGLGLPIVRALLAGGGGGILLLEGTKGAIFQIDLPAASS